APRAHGDVVGVVGQLLALGHEDGGEGEVVLGPPTTQVEGPPPPLADRAAARVDEVDGSPVVPAALEPAEDGGPLGLALQEGTRPPDAQNGGQARQRWGEAF